MIKWHKLEVGEQDRGKIRTEIKSRAENEASNTHSPWNSACLLKLGHRHYCEFLEGNLVCCKTRSARKRCRSIKPQLWVCNKIFLSEIQGLTQKKKKSTNKCLSLFSSICSQQNNKKRKCTPTIPWWEATTSHLTVFHSLECSTKTTRSCVYT